MTLDFRMQILDLGAQNLASLMALILNLQPKISALHYSPFLCPWYYAFSAITFL